MGTKENKGKLRWNHDASVGAAVVGEKGIYLDKTTLNSEEIKLLL